MAVDNSDNTLRKLEACQKRHTEVQATILECVGLLETYLYQRGTFTRDNPLNAYLDREYQGLQSDICNGPVAAGVIAHLKVEADELLNQRSRAAGCTFTPQTIHRLTGLLDEKKAAFDKLRSQIRDYVAEAKSLVSDARRA